MKEVLRVGFEELEEFFWIIGDDAIDAPGEELGPTEGVVDGPSDHAEALFLQTEDVFGRVEKRIIGLNGFGMELMGDFEGERL